MFKVGDKVVYDDEKVGKGRTKGLVMKVRYVFSDSVEIDYGCRTGCIPMRAIRHATPEEIAAGHRIDKEMGDDSHIENHISKNCKVIDYD
ncbi:hypothetical protein [Acinetobacter haemolyticus]|uniref:hypothetical protein n=1 Tax=Acinetobacter haemolyticus TaxID=29430 RepID=UPI003F575610